MESYDKPPSYARSYLWIMWSCGAVFYFYECLLQVSPSIMGHNLMAAFAIHAEGLGYLSAIYFYAYAGMQIPVGMLLDRFGPRRLLSIAAFTCASGCLIFGLAQHLSVACLGRLLIGIGSAFAAIGCLKIASIWFPIQRFTILAGLTVMLGMLGATGGQAPLALFVHHFDWRFTMVVLAIAGCIIAVLLATILRDNPQEKFITHHNKISLWQSLKSVLSNQRICFATAYCGLVFAPTPALAALWGVPFLMTRYGFSKPLAAGFISLVYFGCALGGPFWCFISNAWGSRRQPLIIGSFVSMVFSLIAIMTPLSTWSLGIVLFIFGLSSSSFLLVFAIVREISNNKIAATALGFTNMSTMLGTACVQAIVGYLLDRNWHGKLAHGVRIYHYHDFQTALLVIPLCFALSLLLIPLVHETHCHSSQQNRLNYQSTMKTS